MASVWWFCCLVMHWLAAGTGASLSAYDTPYDTHTASLHSWTACSRLLQGRCHLSTSGCLDALLCTWAA